MPKDLDQLNNLRVIFTVCIMPSCFASVSRFALCYTGLGCIYVVMSYLDYHVQKTVAEKCYFFNLQHLLILLETSQHSEEEEEEEKKILYSSSTLWHFEMASIKLH